MNDQLQSAIRAILKIGGGYLVAKGYTNANDTEVAIAGVAALIGIIWGIYHRAPQPPVVVKPIGPEPEPAKQ